MEWHVYAASVLRNSIQIHHEQSVQVSDFSICRPPMYIIKIDHPDQISISTGMTDCNE